MSRIAYDITGVLCIVFFLVVGILAARHHRRKDSKIEESIRRGEIDNFND